MSSDVDDPPNNGAILNVSKIMTSVNSSTVDAELGALYINACEVVAIRNLLNEMGHKQPKTPMQTDNSTALVGGVPQKMSFFQMVRKSFLSDQTYST